EHGEAVQQRTESQEELEGIASEIAEQKEKLRIALSEMQAHLDEAGLADITDLSDEVEQIRTTMADLSSRQQASTSEIERITQAFDQLEVRAREILAQLGEIPLAEIETALEEADQAAAELLREAEQVRGVQS
ncbi:MAG: hypothetical protein ABH823_05060, partial [bacterium]